MPTADTYNWDTVFAITFPDVNAAIRKAGASPKTFTYTDASTPPDSVKMEGTFGDWQLARGGAGQNVWMTVPITGGTFTLVHTDPITKTPATTTADLTNAVVTIEVRLALIPQPGASATTGSQDLKVQATGATGNAVAVQTLTLGPGVSIGPTAVAVLKSVVQRWLNANLQAFNHVFATVNLNTKADQVGFQWLMPTKVSYAVSTENKPLEGCVFAVLCMTEGREGQFMSADLSQQVSPNAIPTGARSGFLIAPERFLTRMVLPGIPTLFMNATVDDFRVGEDATAIRNINLLRSQTFKLDDGTEVSPDIDPAGFTFAIDENKLRLTFDSLHFQYSPGVDADIKFTSSGSLTLDESKRIVLAMEDGSTAGSAVTTSSNVRIAEIVVGIATMVAGAILGFCLPGEGTVTIPVTDPVIESAEIGLNDMVATVTADEGGIGAAVPGGNGMLKAAEEMGQAAENQLAETTQPAGWFARNWKKLEIAVAATLVGNVIPSIEPIIEAVRSSHLEHIPSLDALAKSAAKPTTWPNASQYTLTSAQMNGSLQLGGDPGFAA